MNFLGGRIAATNLRQVDLDKPRNYLWYCYEKAPPPPLPPFGRAGRQCSRSPVPGNLSWLYLVIYRGSKAVLVVSEFSYSSFSVNNVKLCEGSSSQREQQAANFDSDSLVALFTCVTSALQTSFVNRRWSLTSHGSYFSQERKFSKEPDRV